MALIFRTSSLANTGPTFIKNAALTYEQGDGNFAYLLTNMSGSTVTISGATTVTGSLEVVGPVTTFNGVGFWDPTSLSFINITANNGKLILTGSLFGTASWATSASNAASASWAPTPDLQKVLDKGNISSTGIRLSDGAVSDVILDPYSVKAYDDASGAFTQMSYGGIEFNLDPHGLVLIAPFHTTNRTINLPNADGTVVVSVNGVGADTSGNVNLPALNTGSLLITASVSSNTITFTKGNGSTFPITVETGSINLGGYTTTASFHAFTASYNTGSFSGSFAGQLIGTSSWSNNALTASFVTASNIYGPHGANSVLSSSFAISASWAPFTAVNTGSLLTTASVSLNTITFTKGDGSTFPITVDTGSGGGSPVDTSAFLTTGSLSTTQQLSGSLNVTGSLNFFSGSTNVSKIENGWVVLTYVSTSLDFANDTAAAIGGVPLGGLYRNGNAVSIRIV